MDLQNNYQLYVLGWAAAYSQTGKLEGQAVDVDEVDQITPIVMNLCAKKPKGSLLNKVKIAKKQIAKATGKPAA